MLQVLDENSSRISLMSVYPRQELTSEMDSLSMTELGLMPTGVIIVRMEKVECLLFVVVFIVVSCFRTLFKNQM